jgi:hypothetical protein
MQIATAEAVRDTRYWVTTPDGLESWATVYFDGTARRVDQPIVPQAFLIEQPPASQAKPHFHQVDQFQIFVRGSGQFGKRPVPGPMAHYASAGTPYGPITAGPDGISYLTLRNGRDPGGLYMPESREKLRAFGRRPRAVVSDPIDRCGETVFAVTPDGLGGWLHRISSGREFTARDSTNGAGQYVVVLRGSFTLESGALLSPLSCVFVWPGDPPVTGTASADGADLLQLQFPEASP